MHINRFTLAIAALALSYPQLASAHPELVSSTPSANATVSAPTKVVLHFEETVVGAATHAELTMTGMPGMADHKPMAITGLTAQLGKDKKSLTLVLRKPLTAGSYQVSWTAVGTDTHRLTGKFSFTVK